MKTNIALICLLPNYSKNISKLLSDKLDMFYVNVEEMVDFELGDLEHILNTLGERDGRKFIRDSENKIIKNVSNFENTIISINPITMFANRNFDRISKTSYIVYLQIAPKFFKIRAQETADEISESMLNIAFTERDKMYVDRSDIVVNCSSYKTSKAVKKVVSSINSFFKKLNKTRNKKVG